MCTQEVGSDTRTSVLADDQRPEQRWQRDREKQGGDTQNVITAAKLLSIKAKLQKYVARGLPTMKTELCFSGCRSGSCPALCFVGFTMSKGTPDSTAAGRRQAARVGGCVEIHTGPLLSCLVNSHQAPSPQ